MATYTLLHATNNIWYTIGWIDTCHEEQEEDILIELKTHLTYNRGARPRDEGQTDRTPQNLSNIKEIPDCTKVGPLAKLNYILRGEEIVNYNDPKLNENTH